MHRPDVSSSAAFKRPVAWARGAWRARATPRLPQKYLCWGLECWDNQESCLCEASIQISAVSFCTHASLTSLVGVPPKGFSLISLCTYKVKSAQSSYKQIRCVHIFSLASTVLSLFYYTFVSSLKYASGDFCFVLSIAMASGTALIYDEEMTSHKLLWNE